MDWHQIWLLGRSWWPYSQIRVSKEARNRGYSFVTGYVHRIVIMSRKNRGETIELVQKYDPDKLDYYRIDLERHDATTHQHSRGIETMPPDLGIR